MSSLPKTLVIEKLGGMGGGIAHSDGTTYFVPFTLAGECVEAIAFDESKHPVQTRLLKVLQASSDRVEPPCPHFTTCGGCQLQHMSRNAYETFKRSILQQAVLRAGADAACVTPLFTVQPATRRRAEFTIAQAGGDIQLGFAEAASNRVVALESCPILQPAIFAVLPVLRALLASLKKPKLFRRLHITLVDGAALDITIHVSHPPSADDLATLKSANISGLARLALQLPSGALQTLQKTGTVALTLGGVAVELPAGAFLQATAESQIAMQELVMQRVEDARKVIDLYAGCGTYSLPLAASGKMVHGVEGSQDMVAALHNAGKKLSQGHLSSSVRDLFKSPVQPEELAHYDAVVINPPRNGALPQTQAIAESGVKRVVMVSCNPATFARDAAALIKKGYRMESATPIDQFLWSHHLELVASFVKA